MTEWVHWTKVPKEWKVPGFVALVRTSQHEDLPVIECLCAYDWCAGWCVDEIRHVEWLRKPTPGGLSEFYNTPIQKMAR